MNDAYFYNSSFHHHSLVASRSAAGTTSSIGSFLSPHLRNTWCGMSVCALHHLLTESCDARQNRIDTATIC